MAIKKIPLFLFLLVGLTVSAQVGRPLKSGPWAGNVELRNATIWLEVSPEVASVAGKFHKKNQPATGKTVHYKGILGKDFNPIKIELNGLEMNTGYTYQVMLDGKPVTPGFITAFTTKDLWQWRKPAADFSFLAGSCAYFNEPVFDRPGKPYGGDSTIFETMAGIPAAFHIWMGDNWYTREADYNTRWGLNYRASRDRSLPVLQRFMASMPQYAIWDDHDFGPDNSGSNYILKKESREIFMQYTCNSSYGEEDKWIYSVMSSNDVDVVLTDSRYFRSAEDLPDTVNGVANANKFFFGHQQLNWIKNSLLFSKATFKIIVVGSQVLNTISTAACMQQYKSEYAELMRFLLDHKIPGVLFFTGDRHHSEVIKMERPGLFPLYDVTFSPYTAGISKVRGVEIDHKGREAGTLVEAQNFAKVSVSGGSNNRVLTVQFIGVQGEQLGSWRVSESTLRQAGAANP